MSEKSKNEAVETEKAKEVTKKNVIVKKAKQVKSWAKKHKKGLIVSGLGITGAYGFWQYVKRHPVKAVKEGVTAVAEPIVEAVQEIVH